MATLTLPDATVQRLRALAAARRLSLDAFLDEVAAREVHVPSDSSSRQLAALESFATGMTAWTSRHVPPGHFADDSREAIYEGRGG